MKKIHVGLLLSYDYEKLKLSIPPVYKNADRIFIACDKDFRTWSGNKFVTDKSFFDWIDLIDVDNKIEFYYDDFYIPTLTPIQNDTRERHMLSLKMGLGNWMVQIDSDEIFIDFENFVEKLKKHNEYLINPERTPIQFAGFLINIYKYLDDGILYVNKATKFLVATNYPDYKYARNTKQRIVYLNNYALHETLSRNIDDMILKLANWGHKNEINNTFFDKWKNADKNNYKDLKDLFYLDSKIWPSLELYNSTNLFEFKSEIMHNKKLLKSDFWLLKKNFRAMVQTSL